MFDHAHYVPVLRWKAGERGALKALRLVDKAAMTPLLEPHPAVHAAATSKRKWLGPLCQDE
jgi:hypothetical protein